MNAVVLDQLPFQIDMDRLARRLHLPKDSAHIADLDRLARDAQGIARPKAMYKVGYVESRGDDWVVIDGTRFASRVLRVNLERAHRVLVYVATCGTEVHAWRRSLRDLLQQYWAEAMEETALSAAMKAMNADVVSRYALGKTSTMAPGSLSDWPLAQQRPLFALLGDTQAAIGVRLTDSLLMIPTKSVSGMRFHTEESFESCQLCPRPGCPGRRAPYDRELYGRKYEGRAKGDREKEGGEG